jgi:hypothetical protein
MAPSLTHVSLFGLHLPAGMASRRRPPFPAYDTRPPESSNCTTFLAVTGGSVVLIAELAKEKP